MWNPGHSCISLSPTECGRSDSLLSSFHLEFLRTLSYHVGSVYERTLWTEVRLKHDWLRLWSATLKRQCCLSPEVAWNMRAWTGAPGPCRGNRWGQDDWLWLTRERGCRGIWEDSWLRVHVLTLIGDACLGQGVGNYCSSAICDHTDERTTVGLVDLKKVRLHGLGVRVGEESSGQPVDSPSAEQKALYEKKAWPFWKMQPPSSLHFNASKPSTPGHTQALGPTGGGDVHSAHGPQTALSSATVKGWHGGRPETHQLPWLRRLHALSWPLWRPWAAAANKPRHRAAFAVYTAHAPPKGTLASSVHCLLSKHLGWKGIHVTPGEELWALSITLTKHVGLSPSVIWFACVVLHFLHQTFDKV